MATFCSLRDLITADAMSMYFGITDKIGVYDRIDGPIRGLEREWNHDLESAMAEFLEELNERGY